ncbi:S8 family peptidase [Mesorhizobium sp. KR1-2]|uniref:S8 family peptidase n=1 Tax=Mesorhizobium sp. KR1-2 TaxID=3156609 RepID=UPI0032B34FB9
MATYEHLPLKRIEGELQRRKNGFPGGVQRQPSEHGKKIKADIDATQADFKKLPQIEGVDPSLILKIKVAGLIQDDDWRKLGLSILSIDGDKTTVLFANDKSLASFHQKVDAYRSGPPDGQKHPQFAQLIGSIESVSLVEPEDRIGRVLRSNGFSDPTDFKPDQEYTLDFELHRPNSEDDAHLFIFRLEKLIGAHAGKVLSVYNGQHLLLVRANCLGKSVIEALAMPEVAVIDLPPQPDLATADLSDMDLAGIEGGAPPNENAIVIGIVDSGVNFGHKLLTATEAGSFSASASFGPEDEGGHGTSVASIAAYGDIQARIAANDFDAQFKIASARVTTKDGKFPEETSVPALMEAAITRLHDEFGCRIINISLGDAQRVYDGSRVDPWTATLDRLARDLDIVIVVSAGNRDDLTATYGDKITNLYPEILVEPAARIIAPAIGANVLSVGAIAHSNGLSSEEEELVGVRPICGKEEPAPFTRTGPGIRDMVKPEFVDFGGTAVWDGPTQRLVNGNLKPSAGVWAFAHTPLERIFRSRSGTSFSAPNVSYKAALVMSEFPKASANLIRALLTTSARLPQAPLQRHNPLSVKNLRHVCGYGIASPIDAALSEDSRVVLYTEDSLTLDHFAVYEVPIPGVFQSTKGSKEIRVALAFDPPVRHTRADYLGITMGWRLLRGTSPEEIFDRFRKWEPDEGKPPEFESRFVCPTDIGSKLRERSTLQVGTYVGKSDISGYGDRYYVAVWCARRWAPDEIKAQKFALCVQLRHENVNTLYNLVKTPVRVRT